MPRGPCAQRVFSRRAGYVILRARLRDALRLKEPNT